MAISDRTPPKPFRGLLLTPEQDAEVQAWITSQLARGEPWDTLALDYMLRDMLDPSTDDKDDAPA